MMQVQNSCFDCLKDITDSVQIESPYCVSHPRYGKAELEPERVPQFQNLPPALQNRCLSLQVRNFLHDIYFTGITQPKEENISGDRSPATEQVNNMAWGLNLDFYAKLHASNSGKGFFEPGWRVTSKVDGLLAVTKDNLTLYVERNHLQFEQSADVGEAIAIQMPRNRLEPGWYLAVGDAGGVEQSDRPQIKLYFNFCAEGAISVMSSLTQHLNALRVPFIFQVPYDPLDYHRYNSGILHCDQSNYGNVRSALSELYGEHRSFFREATPLFTKRLASGMAVAEEPSQKFSDQEDFGLNRCQILANALVQAYQQSEYSAEIKRVMIFDQFRHHKISLKLAHLNDASEDVYVDLFL
jgi:HopA1 effector protein family